MHYKECSRCKALKAVEDFCLNRTTKDGYQTYCKACHNVYRKSLRKRKQVEGRRIKSAKVDAVLGTKALCPHCGHEVWHIVK